MPVKIVIVEAALDQTTDFSSRRPILISPGESRRGLDAGAGDRREDQRDEQTVPGRRAAEVDVVDQHRRVPDDERGRSR